jgi:hypothetical protein
MLPKALARHLEPFVAKILFAAYNLGRHYHPKPVPFRCVLAVVTLKDVFPTEAIAPSRPLLERTLGDYTPGWHAWLLTAILHLKTPIPAKGELNLWEWDAPFDVEQLAFEGKTPW